MMDKKKEKSPTRIIALEEAFMHPKLFDLYPWWQPFRLSPWFPIGYFMVSIICGSQQDLSS
jgi:hypothetical protein